MTAIAMTTKMTSRPTSSKLIMACRRIGRARR
jgi:hypothetical protein